MFYSKKINKLEVKLEKMQNTIEELLEVVKLTYDDELTLPGSTKISYRIFRLEDVIPVVYFTFNDKSSRKCYVKVKRDRDYIVLVDLFTNNIIFSIKKKIDFITKDEIFNVVYYNSKIQYNPDVCLRSSIKNECLEYYINTGIFTFSHKDV